MPDHTRGSSAMSEDDATICPGITAETMTTAGNTTAGLDYTSISQWVAGQYDVEDQEDPNPSGSGKKPARELVLHFPLPCGNMGHPFSTEEVVVRGPRKKKLKMRDMVVGKNTSLLEAFINEHFNDVSELVVNFHFGKSESDEETRKQLTGCLLALLELADQCAFTINAEYSMASNPPKRYHPDGTPKTLEHIVVGRFKLLGDKRELKIRNEPE